MPYAQDTSLVVRPGGTVSIWTPGSPDPTDSGEQRVNSFRRRNRVAARMDPDGEVQQSRRCPLRKGAAVASIRARLLWARTRRQSRSSTQRRSARVSRLLHVDQSGRPLGGVLVLTRSSSATAARDQSALQLLSSERDLRSSRRCHSPGGSGRRVPAARERSQRMQRTI
jgi:hypothetical protein